MTSVLYRLDYEHIKGNSHLVLIGKLWSTLEKMIMLKRCAWSYVSFCKKNHNNIWYKHQRAYYISHGISLCHFNVTQVLMIQMVFGISNKLALTYDKFQILHKLLFACHSYEKFQSTIYVASAYLFKQVFLKLINIFRLTITLLQGWKGSNVNCPHLNFLYCWRDIYFGIMGYPLANCTRALTPCHRDRYIPGALGQCHGSSCPDNTEIHIGHRTVTSCREKYTCFP